MTLVAVASMKMGAGGASGTEYAYKYEISEYPLHPFTFYTLYLNLYILPLSMPELTIKLVCY